MTTRNRILAVTSALAMAFAASGADAAVLIEGTGFWGAGTATTAYSQAGRSFQFSFYVPDSFASDVSSATTYDITDFTYTLNNVAVATLPTAVQFWNTANNGLFDIIFGSTTVSLFGTDVGSDGTVGPAGGYTFTSGLNGGAATGGGFVTITPDISAAVPEPATWALMILGFGAVAGALRYRRSKTSVRFAA